MFLRLLETWVQLGRDEREVIVEIASRLLMGQRQYGELDLERDMRDFVQQAAEEHFDSCVYMAGEVVRLRRQSAGGVAACAVQNATSATNK